MTPPLAVRGGGGEPPERSLAAASRPPAWLVGGVAILVAGAPLTVNAFGATFRAACHVLGLGLGLAVLADRRRTAAVRRLPAGMVAWLLAFWLYQLLRTPGSLDPPAALVQILDRTTVISVFLVAASGLIGEGRRTVIGAGLVGMAVVALWGVLQPLGIHPFLDPAIWEPSRPTRPLGTHNLMGAFAGAWLPLAVVSAVAATGWRRGLSGTGALLALACFLLSSSRGAWLAAGLAAAALTPWWVRGGSGLWRAALERDRRGLAVLAGLAVAVVVASAGSIAARLATPERSGVLEPPGTAARGAIEAAGESAAARSERPAPAEPPASALTSFERRTLVAETALALIGRHPVWGSGPGSFRLAFYTARPPAMQRLEAETGQTAVRAHSDPLELAAELGLVGLALAVGWVVVALRIAWRGIDPARRPPRRWGGGAGLIDAALVVGAAVLGLHALVDFSLSELPTALLAAVFLGFAVAGGAEMRAEAEVRAEAEARAEAAAREARGAAGEGPEPGRGRGPRPPLAAPWRAAGALVLAAGVGVAILPAAADRAYRRAYAALEAGDLARSERWLERALAAGPDRAATWVARGEVARHRAASTAVAAERRAALGAAAAHFEAAARLEPQIAAAWMRAAAALEAARAAGAPAAADSIAAWLERAWALNPYLAEAARRRGDLALGVGDGAGARTWYERALVAAGSASPELELGLGNAAYAAGDLAGAERRYQAALAGRPEFAAAVQNLGNVALARGDSGAAGRLYARALALDPSNAALREFIAGLDLGARIRQNEWEDRGAGGGRRRTNGNEGREEP